MIFVDVFISTLFIFWVSDLVFIHLDGINIVFKNIQDSIQKSIDEIVCHGYTPEN